MNSDEKLDLVVTHRFSKRPSGAKLPERVKVEDNIRVLDLWRRHVDMASCDGGFRCDGQLGHHALVEEEIRRQRRVLSRAGKLHRVRIPVVDDLQFTPEHTRHERAIVGPRHVEIVGITESLETDDIAR